MEETPTKVGFSFVCWKRLCGKMKVMDIILGGYVFLFGLIVGSFLNVVIYRFNTGASLQGRSMCFSCGKTLRWYELVPVFSFLIQKGRCRKCHAKISWQYPLVELLTGVLYTAVFFFAAYDWVYFSYLLLQITLLVIIGVYDIKHKIIPDVFSYAFAIFALGYVLYEYFIGGFSGNIIYALAAGPVYFLPFAAMWYFSKGTWMGFGDAKLALGIGWFLGLAPAYISMMLSFWIGAIVGLVLIGYGKLARLKDDGMKVTMKSEIPFGPFLILGLLITLFFGSYTEVLFSFFMFT